MQQKVTALFLSEAIVHRTDSNFNFASRLVVSKRILASRGRTTTGRHSSHVRKWFSPSLLIWSERDSRRRQRHTTTDQSSVPRALLFTYAWQNSLEGLVANVLKHCAFDVETTKLRSCASHLSDQSYHHKTKERLSIHHTSTSRNDTKSGPLRSSDPGGDAAPQVLLKGGPIPRAMIYDGRISLMLHQLLRSLLDSTCLALVAASSRRSAVVNKARS